MTSISCFRLFATPWAVAYQGPPSMGFSRQEYWSGLSFPSPGDLPDPGMEPRSPALQTDTLLSEPLGKPLLHIKLRIKTSLQIIFIFHDTCIFSKNINRNSIFNFICLLLNTFESVLMRWMKLEPIIQSEVSQKEKHQYSILTHIYGI